MKVWVYLDGRQQGPFSMEQLLDMPVDENTKVWFEGLPKWYPAGSLEEMRPLFDGSLTAAKQENSIAEAADTDGCEEDGSLEDVQSEAESVQPEQTEYQAPAPQARYAPGRRYVAAQMPDKPCPPTYLGWTIFLTICCCSPVSLAGLVASICVTSFYNSGKLDSARKASEVTAWLVMIAIALGMIPVMLMSAMFGE